MTTLISLLNNFYFETPHFENSSDIVKSLKNKKKLFTIASSGIHNIHLLTKNLDKIISSDICFGQLAINKMYKVALENLEKKDFFYIFCSPDSREQKLDRLLYHLPQIDKELDFDMLKFILSSDSDSYSCLNFPLNHKIQKIHYPFCFSDRLYNKASKNSKKWHINYGAVPEIFNNYAKGSFDGVYLSNIREWLHEGSFDAIKDINLLNGLDRVVSKNGIVYMCDITHNPANNFALLNCDDDYQSLINANGWSDIFKISYKPDKQKAEFILKKLN
jgi:S-adenosylmethionine:diacylglycerol 3-amino-3-carboxypropyl transferase